MVEMATLIRGSHGVWFIDNVAALMALGNGRSNRESLDEITRVAHLLSFGMRAVPYYEYVQSASNWSDEISREGLAGRWAKDRRFELQECSVLPMLFDLPPRAILNLAEFL